MNFHKESFFVDRQIPSGSKISYNVLSKAYSQFSTLLLDRNVSLSMKIDGLCKLWQRLLMFLNDFSEDLNEFIQLICDWSLNIVLSDDWDSLKSATKLCLLTSMKLCKSQLSKSRTGLNVSIDSLDTLINIYHKPWEITFLDKVFNDQTVSREDAIDYYRMEGSCVLKRIKVLIVSQCEDLALKLVDSCLGVTSDKQAELLQELHFILLCRLNRIKQLTDELRVFSIEKIMTFLNSFLFYSQLPNVSFGISSLNTCLKSVVNQCFDISMSKVVLENDISLLKKVCNMWIKHVVMKINDQTKVMSILSSTADMFVSSEQLYHLCEKSNDLMFGTNKIFCIEMLMRALTANINEFENLEDKEEKKKSAQTLSRGFLKLATIVEASDTIVRECLLTSFSLYPTNDLYTKIQGILSSLENKENRSLWNDGAKIGLSQQECDDLIILFEVHRHSSLSWTLDEKQLLRNCQAHLSQYEKTFEQIPLNHLHIDYSQFDHMPRPEVGAYEGIEKGYEKFLDNFASQNVKDVVKELRFLREDVSKQDGQISKDATVDLTDKIAHANNSTRDETVVRSKRNKPVELIKIENTLTANQTKNVPNQKPLVPKLNDENTLSQQSSHRKTVQRKEKRKMNSKENKAQWKIEPSVGAKNQTLSGLKRVIYPKKIIEIQIEEHMPDCVGESMDQDGDKHCKESSLQNPTRKPPSQYHASSEDTTYIDLSSYQSVSQLVSASSLTSQQKNSPSSPPKNITTKNSTNPPPENMAMKKHTMNTSDGDIQMKHCSINLAGKDQMNSNPGNTLKGDHLKSSPTIPLGYHDKKFVHIFNEDAYLMDHDYFLPEPHYLTLYNEHDYFNSCDQEFDNKLDKLNVQVEHARVRQPVNMCNLLEYRVE